LKSNKEVINNLAEEERRKEGGNARSSAYS
jgi:hypothetical protein